MTFGRGADEGFLITKVLIFGLLGTGVGINILALFGYVESFRLRFPNVKYLQKLNWVGSLINNFQYGIIGINMNKDSKAYARVSSVLNQILAVFPFLIIPIFLGITQTGIPDIPSQQVTESAKLYLSVEPASSEIAPLSFFLSLIVFPFLILKKKYKLSNAVYSVYIGFIGTIISIIYGIAIHLLRYRDSDIALFKVGFFWGINGLLQLLTGNIFIAWIYKFMNNLFQALKDISQTNETVQVIILSVLFMIYVLFWIIKFILIQNQKRKKGKEKT